MSEPVPTFRKKGAVVFLMLWIEHNISTMWLQVGKLLRGALNVKVGGHDLQELKCRCIIRSLLGPTLSSETIRAWFWNILHLALLHHWRIRIPGLPP